MSGSLKQRAIEIRDETNYEGNTAERIGNLMLDIIKELEKTRSELEEARSKLDEFMGFTYIESIDFPAEGGTTKIGVKTTCKEWEVS